jgi:two-component system copper resistance phosphate regulon response regulator CusR
MRILLVEDEPRMAGLIARGLRDESHAADVAEDGESALEHVAVNDYDAVILDLTLPGIDGIEVCRRMRASGLRTPVLMLTARDAVADRIAGLDVGADDYLVKPFDFGELLARLRALRRRSVQLQSDRLTVDDLIIDTATREVRRDGTRIELTAKEYALLEFLARRAGAVIGRAEISEHVWDETFDPFSNAIEVYIKRLRRKIDDGRAFPLILTWRGAGYSLGRRPTDHAEG